MVSVSEATAATAAAAPAIDVSFVVDESGSVKTLCRGTLECYNGERHFAMELVTLLNADVGFFGKGGTALYMEYSSAVNVNAAFSAEADFVSFVEAQTHTGGGTYIGTAIAEATETLLALPGREDRSQIMVVMTDGHEGGNTDPAGEAALAAEAGITMYVVAVDVASDASPTCDDSDFWPSCIDEATMLRVAGAPERLFVVNTFERLTDTVLRDVRAGIGIPCAAGGATLSMELFKEPIAAPEVSSGEVEISGTTVTWTMGSVRESANMTFAVDYCQCEHQRSAVDFIASATYTDDEMNEPSLQGLLDLTAQVTELCSTPAPSAAPTLSPTIPPTISPTISRTILQTVFPTARATNSSLPTPFLPTPAPHPLSNVAGRDSDTPWYQRLSIVLPVSAAMAAAVVLWAAAKGFCCCFGRKVAVSTGEKKKVKCPACRQPVWVAYDSLQHQARCSCDILREKAEARARGGRAGTARGMEGARSDVMNEGFNRRVLAPLDPEHASTCVHCGVSFCTPCDVRDNKRAFLFLIENIPDKKEGETRAAGRSMSESRKAKQMWKFLRGQRKRIRVEPGPADEKNEGVEVQRPGEEGDEEGGGGGGRQQQGGGMGGHEARLGGDGGSETTNGQQRDPERRGSKRRSIPEIVVQRPPVPFSNGPYPKALPLPSDSGKQGQDGEAASPPRSAASERESIRDQAAKGKGAEGGIREESEQRKEGTGKGGWERPGDLKHVWSSFWAAISGRQ
eukprot:g12090.t1